ncbi:MAG: ATP-binding protein [Hyphomicrobiaceae bacterium]
MKGERSLERLSGVPRSLVALLIASVSAALILSLAVARGGDPGERLTSLSGLMAASIVTALVTLVVGAAWTLVRLSDRSGLRIRGQSNEILALRARLAASEQMLKVEPQGLMLFEHGQPPRLQMHGLDAGLGVPRVAGDIMRLSGWLEAEGAREASQQIEALVKQGQPFTLAARTLSGGHVEIEGRVAGSRALVKIREAAGQLLELSELKDRVRRQARELQLTRTLFEALPTPIAIRGADSRIEWVNLAYVRAVSAANREEVRNRQIELLESRQRTAFDKVLRGGRIYRDRVHLIVGSERRAFDVVGVPLEQSSAMIATDVAAIDEAKGEISRLIAAHDRTLDRVATAVAIFGPDQRLVFSNEAYRRLWQIDPEWLASHPRDGEILDRLRESRRLPEEADYRAWKTKQLACYGLQAEHEDWWHLPGGRAVRVIAEQRPDGGVTYLYDDVTERLALESRYNELITVQSETLDHLKEGVAVFATDGRLRLFNPAFARIWKLNPQDLAREPHVDEVIRRCRVLHDDEETWTGLNRAVTTISDQRQRIEGQMVRPDDSVIAYAGLPLPDGAMLMTFIDITDSKRVERALVEKNEALEAASRLKSQFLSHVSYELRTPLTNIIGFSELLNSPRTGPLTDKQREYLGDIGASSKTLLSIINDILDLATIDAGAFELKLATVEVRGLVEHAAHVVRDRLARAKLHLDIELSADAVSFVADENRVRQVLYNLLSNAIGFSEPGGHITLGCRRADGMMIFSVADQGVGIPEEHQWRVFERFESRTQGSKHRGAGLGLALVKNLVELHGGDVSLSSSPGKGTTVTVRLPEVARAAEPEPQPARRPRAPRRSPRAA